MHIGYWRCLPKKVIYNTTQLTIFFSHLLFTLKWPLLALSFFSYHHLRTNLYSLFHLRISYRVAYILQYYSYHTTPLLNKVFLMFFLSFYIFDIYRKKDKELHFFEKILKRCLYFCFRYRNNKFDRYDKEIANQLEKTTKVCLFDVPNIFEVSFFLIFFKNFICLPSNHMLTSQFKKTMKSTKRF